MNKKYVVRLSSEERAMLEGMIRAGTGAARKLAHARILLKADSRAGGPGWEDRRISDAVEVSPGTVQRIRQLFVEQGMEAALQPQPTRRVYETKLDGVGEARLIALACGDPPAGRARWSLRLLAEKLVEVTDVDTIAHETVRRVLKKTNCSRGGRTSGVSLPQPMRSS